jgi:hypothetical protein
MTRDEREAELVSLIQTQLIRQVRQGRDAAVTGTSRIATPTKITRCRRTPTPRT